MAKDVEDTAKQHAVIW